VFMTEKSPDLAASFTAESYILKAYGAAGAVKALHHENAIFRALTDTLPQMVWSTLADGSNDYFNARWYAFTGVSDGATEGDRWSDVFHPDFQAEAQRRWQHSVATGEPYAIEHKLRHASGAYRWVITRGSPVRDDSGRIVRWIGTCTDIDDAKRDAEQNEVLSRELSHRIKNIFAVISGLIALSAHRQPEVDDFASTLQARITALGRAHEFVRPHSDRSQPQFAETTVQAMVRDLLKPYPALAEGRLTIVGDNARIDDRTATPLALVFHELATNASKYGALSTPDGTVSINMRIAGDAMNIHWIEGNGPVVSERSAAGFGSELIEMSISQQLGGTLTHHWDAAGLVVDIVVPMARLNR
jgi:PAS domain S-box-containing protein